MRGHLSPAVSSHKSDLWHSPMGQVTGLGLDLWQPLSGNPAEVKSGICFDVSVSHPCDDEAPQASMLCAQLRTVCVRVCSIRPHAWRRPTGMFVAPVLASLKGSLPCHLSLSSSLFLPVSAALSLTPLPAIILLPFTAPIQHDWNIPCHILWQCQSSDPVAFFFVWSLLSDQSWCGWQPVSLP